MYAVGKQRQWTEQFDVQFNYAKRNEKHRKFCLKIRAEISCEKRVSYIPLSFPLLIFVVVKIKILKRLR